MSPVPRLGLRRRRLGAFAVVGAVALAAILIALSSGTHGRTDRQFHGHSSGAGSRRAGSRANAAPARVAPPSTPVPSGLAVSVNVDLRQPDPPIPAGFLGLSFEDVALGRVAGYARNQQVARLLRALGGPSLRFGGVSADARVAWSEAGTLPRWASGEVTPSDLRSLATLAGETGARVVLTVNLGHYDPAAAAREAAAARALLGTRLAAIAIGNEPDRFAVEGLRGPAWSFSAYAREFDAYRAAIARTVPGVPIAGPDASSGEPVLPWLRAAAELHANVLTDHYYPLSSCDGSSPTVGELLSPATRERESSMLQSLGAIERAAGAPLQIDETNDISCKGEPGVSDTFASALWASDYIARALAAGVRGLDFHDLITWPGSYSPLVAGAGGLHANPEYYALLLARALRGARPVHAALHGAGDLSAWAFVRPNGAIQLVLVNFQAPGSTPMLVKLGLSPRDRSQAGLARQAGAGTILRLTGPSPYASSHVRLGTAEVSATGGWRPRLPLPGVYERAGTRELALPPSSAALVTLAP